MSPQAATIPSLPINRRPIGVETVLARLRSSSAIRRDVRVTATNTVDPSRVRSNSSRWASSSADPTAGTGRTAPPLPQTCSRGPLPAARCRGIRGSALETRICHPYSMRANSSGKGTERRSKALLSGGATSVRRCALKIERQQNGRHPARDGRQGPQHPRIELLPLPRQGRFSRVWIRRRAGREEADRKRQVDPEGCEESRRLLHELSDSKSSRKQTTLECSTSYAFRGGERGRNPTPTHR